MILLLTHSGDFYTIDRVRDALLAMGAECAVVHTDRFPQHAALSSLFASGSSASFQGQLVTQNGADASQTFNLQEVTAVWNRRLWPGLMPADIPPEAAAQNSELCKHAFNETLALTQEAYWMNPVHAGLMSESKSLQLKLAVECGLRIPDTLISNDPGRIRKFFHRNNGNLITKTLLPMATSMDAAPDFAYTCKVQEDQLELLDVARLSPQIYQPCVEKKWELRVAVVGDAFFIAGIRGADGSPPGLDWRSPQHPQIEWFKSELPDQTKQQLLNLMKRLGIVYGSADFIVEDPDGEPVFLELNQAGEWGMLERDLDFPIAKTIAENLYANRRNA